MPRFVKTTKGRFVLDEAALTGARRLAGLKGYADVSVMPTSGGPVVVMLGSGAV